MRSLSLLLLLSLASHLRGRCGIPLRRRQRPCQLHPTRLPRRAGRRDRRGGQPAAGRQERHAEGRDEDEKGVHRPEKRAARGDRRKRRSLRKTPGREGTPQGDRGAANNDGNDPLRCGAGAGQAGPGQREQCGGALSVQGRQATGSEKRELRSGGMREGKGKVPGGASRSRELRPGRPHTDESRTGIAFSVPGRVSPCPHGKDGRQASAAYRLPAAHASGWRLWSGSILFLRFAGQQRA